MKRGLLQGLPEFLIFKLVELTVCLKSRDELQQAFEDEWIKLGLINIDQFFHNLFLQESRNMCSTRH